MDSKFRKETTHSVGRAVFYSVHFNVAIISLIYQLNARAQLNIVLLVEYLLRVSVLTVPSPGRTFITSRNYLLIVMLLQWLKYRA